MTTENNPDKRDRKTVIKMMALSTILALISFALVWLITTFVAWQFSNNSYGMRPEQWTTQEFLQGCSSEIAEYAIQGKISEFDLRTYEPPNEYYSERLFHTDNDGQWLDGWGRPYLIESGGGNVVVTSLGRDGKPGGVGLDIDLTSDETHPLDFQPTFGQFLQTDNANAKEVRMWCLAISVGFFVVVVTGALLLIYTASKITTKQYTWLFTQICSLIVFIGFTAFFGGLISLLHVNLLPPYISGH